MQDLGAELRGARLRLGWELPAVAAGLHVRQSYLEAVEAGRLSELPGRAYATDFVRAYADVLGLDAGAVLQRFQAERAIPSPPFRAERAGAIAERREGEVGVAAREEIPHLTPALSPSRGGEGVEAVPPAAPAPWRRVPAHAAVAAGVVLVLALAAYAGWQDFSAPGRPSARVVVIPQPAAARPAPVRRTPAAATPPVTPEPASVPAAVSAAVPAPPPAATPRQPAPPPPSVQPAPAAATPPPAPAAEPAPNPVAKMTLRATASAWVEVRQRHGRVLFSRVMQPGETWTVPAGETDLLLSTGNAGGTELVVDGVSKSLGPSGAVLTDVPLAAGSTGSADTR